MKTLFWTALVGVILTASDVWALSLVPRSPASPPRVIGLDTQKRNVNPLDHDRHRKSKRAGTVTETLDNKETLYFADVSLGTPAQSLRLHIDTGSSDLWCNSASSSLCQQSSEECAASGTYDPTQSSTYTLLNSDFNISYVDGSGASGDYVTDTLAIGGQTLTKFQFGVGTESTSAEGVLGIGYPSNEVQVNRLKQDAYANLPQAMVDAKLIQSPAYSLWLNDLDAGQGQILFGGINTAKFSGSLESVPIIKEYGSYYEFIIALTGLSINTSGSKKTLSSTSSLPAPALLDSGSSLIYLPDDLTTDIFDAVNAVYNSNAGIAYVPCSFANNDSSIDFTFSSAIISVPFNELVLDISTSSSGSQQTFQDGTPACIFGIAPADGTTPVLGDTFLRSAYIVYDLLNNEISLAQTNFNASSDDIKEIGTGTASVPDATTVSNPVTSVTVETGGARLGGVASGTSQPTSLSSAEIPYQVPPALFAASIVAGIMFTL